MRVGNVCTALAFAVVFSSLASAALAQRSTTLSCPEGHAVQGIDIRKGSLICVPLSAGSPSGGLRMVDRDGQLVGHLLSQGTLVRKFGDHWYLFGASATGGFLDSGVTVFYESPDCSGESYLFADLVTIPRIVQPVGGGESTTFYLTTPGSARTINVRSARFFSAGFDGGCAPQLPMEFAAERYTTVTVTNPLPWRLID